MSNRNRSIRTPVINKDLIEEYKKLSNKNKNNVDINANDIGDVVSSNMAILNDIDDIIELFPDINLAKEIFTSLVLSPNTMSDTKINTLIKNRLLPHSTLNSITEFTRRYVDEEYEVNEKASTIVEETIYDKGAYAEINIPASFVNNLIKEIKRSDIKQV